MMGWGPWAPCLKAHPLDLAPGRTALWGGRGGAKTLFFLRGHGRAGPSGHLILGAWGWGLERGGVGATAPELCCLLVDSHQRQWEGLGGRATPPPTQDCGMGREGQPTLPCPPCLEVTHAVPFLQYHLQTCCSGVCPIAS